MIKVAIIGFGGIANGAHYPAYKKLEEEGVAKVVAVCDVDENRFGASVAINIGSSDDSLARDFATYTDWREMLQKEEVDMVDICVPTFIHDTIANAVLEMGYNVMSEKPMALNYDRAVAMVETAKKHNVKLMIGQCLRFGAHYRFLKKAVDENLFGEIKTGIFRRFSGPPLWGWEGWFTDIEKSGGALLDMHIHDIDIIRYLLGEPEAVSCNTANFYSGDDVAHSTLYYPNGVSVLALGDWSREGCDFQADFTVAFEKATVTLCGDQITIAPRGGEKYVADVTPNNFYEEEIRFFIDMIVNGAENTENPPESAAVSVKLIETLRESARKNGEKVPFNV